MGACRGRESVKGTGEQSMDSFQPWWHMSDVVEATVAQLRVNKHSRTRAGAEVQSPLSAQCSWKK